jgi:membrane-bound lytic murein transglycosylase D
MTPYTARFQQLALAGLLLGSTRLVTHAQASEPTDALPGLPALATTEGPAAPAQPTLTAQLDEGSGTDDVVIQELDETLELERRFLADRIPGPLPGFIGTDGIYEEVFDAPEAAFATDGLNLSMADDAFEQAMPPAEALVMAMPELSFDPALITRLPFDLQTVDHALLIEFLEFYNTEGRTRAARWFARAGRYRALIEEVADELGAPRELLWVAAIESSFTPTARSHAGAVGMWQFMSVTAREYGMRIDRYVDERRDPVLATRHALQHLLDLHGTFRSWPLALAAYNAGGGHVRSEVREHNVTNFWNMDVYGCIYDASRRYALRAMALAVIDLNREAFGFEGLQDDEPWRFDSVAVPGNVRLSLLADAANMTIAELREYNPSLLLNTTPGSAEFALRLPAGSVARFVDEYDDLSRRYGQEHTEAVVFFGETVVDLAAAFGVPQRVFRQVNGLGSDDEPMYGDVVLIPGTGRERAPVQAPDRPEVLVLPPTRYEVPDAQRVFYDVNTRDTLAQIADHFEVDLYELAAWNDVDPNAAIFSGQTLQIFIRTNFDLSQSMVRLESQVVPLHLNSVEYVEHLEQEDEPEPAPRRTTRYTVRRGDTMSAIARRHGLTTRELLRLNRLSEDDSIHPGQTLVVSR